MPTMALRYQTGEEIHRGDRVTYGGNAGTIELVVEVLTGELEEDWLFETNRAGIMVAEPKVFGRVYLHDPQEDEDLLFVARSQ
jgi:hypothetical protein